MLVSHRKKFIYTKTAKTAGTSVELFFEPYCLPANSISHSHERGTYVGESGIVGYRGRNSFGHKWFNHMPAYRIKQLLGEEVWEEYFKFCVIRNPFDRLVSAFYHCERVRAEPLRLDNLRRKWRFGKVRVQGTTEIERFRSWLAAGGDMNDRDKYLIDGKVCVDYFIRYDSLSEGVQDVCTRLGISYDPERLPRLKSGLRNNVIPLEDYYDAKSIELVRSRYALEIEMFGFGLD
ncbi:MAG: hypothetical protein D6698_07185 [Gammaproteobacteria bacterium]|nr:MAG: hypothetical protein D6698_07185 [Gammaproteobacteria bacterium]